LWSESGHPKIIQTGIQLHLAGLSLSNTKQYLESLGGQRSRTGIHNWIQKADLQPADGASPNRVAVDETAIQIAQTDIGCMPPSILKRTNSSILTRFLSKISNLRWCFSTISERNTK